MDWPDYGLPADEADAFDAFTEAWERIVRAELVDIACDGGTGRTGVALACLAILGGVEPDEAVEWVRSHYDGYAVEGRGQEALVERFGSSRRQVSLSWRMTAPLRDSPNGRAIGVGSVSAGGPPTRVLSSGASRTPFPRP